MSALQGRLDRLERRVSAQAGAQRHDDRSPLYDYFNALTTRDEREEFLVLAQDVHAVEQREVEAHAAGQALPPRSAAEQARIDELNRCVEAQQQRG
jgi:uncharacterized coiled-coil protein SlyX